MGAGGEEGMGQVAEEAGEVGGELGGGSEGGEAWQRLG